MPESIFRLLPATVAACMGGLPAATKQALEEIRIRESRALEIVYLGRFRYVAPDGRELEHPSGAYNPSREDCIKLLDKLSNHSLYTLEEELRRGFITVKGGHRIGIAGRTVLDKGLIKQVRDITCFNIRIAREIHGVSSEILSALLDHQVSTVHQTLILSPPGQGKTTLLRDLVRQISYGKFLGVFPWNGLKVAMVDERSELAACVGGVPSFDIGPRTDVLDGCPKAEGLMMMIRSMSPDVIAVDEIGRAEDAEGIREAMLSGVRVMATAHGTDMRDAWNKPVLKQLIDMKRFTRYVVLGSRGDNRKSYAIFDEEGRPVRRMKTVTGGIETP